MTRVVAWGEAVQPREQPYRVAKRLKTTAPMMCAWAGFNANDAEGAVAALDRPKDDLRQQPQPSDHRGKRCHNVGEFEERLSSHATNPVLRLLEKPELFFPARAIQSGEAPVQFFNAAAQEFGTLLIF